MNLPYAVGVPPDESERVVPLTKNLDYVEQETGTAHERDMEKQRGQAQGNQDLEVTKAILAKTKTATGGEKPGDVEAAVGYNQLSAKIRDGSNLGEPVPQ